MSNVNNVMLLLKKCLRRWHLFGSGKGGAVRAGAVFRGRWTAGNLVGVRQRSAIHLSTHTLLVKGGLEESRVTVKLHQVEDLWGKKSVCEESPGRRRS